MQSIKGFTLIELVIVIVLIGILAVIVTPSWNATAFNVNYEAFRVLNDIRYTQALSVATGQRYRWVKLSASTYAITNESGSAVVMPNGGSSVTLTSGVTIGGLTNLPNSLVAFDSRGVPYTTSAYPGTALAGTAIIPITASGQTRNVVITPQTGYGTLQ